MSLKMISAGENAPQQVNVVIEIPARGEPVKYEIDKESGAMFVDRFLTTAMRYPCNYGYIPHTLSEDGDPVDVLVITPHPLVSCSVIKARPIGMLKMTDEAGIDTKILAVPISKLSRDYEHVKAPQDLPVSQLETIEHFFEHYKDLEPNKWVKVEGWQGVEAAHQEIINSIERYKIS
ncbi:MAG: inorganic diphosphatase [Legionellales bacterium]|nr:inorganic diphosphatase [Legionellales bacterium]